MKHVNKIGGGFCFLLAVVLSLHLLGHDALAAEKSSSWRPTYDLILRWINFGIIVFVIVKYAKTPLLNFLRGQKDKLAIEIKRLEDEKEDAAAKIKETLTIIDESEIRLSELKDRIVQQGERKKAEIIELAQNQAKIMMEDAKRRVNTYFLQARDAFKAELVDKAIDMALERLPGEITSKDSDRFISDFLESTSSE
ncbi:MAG: ATP synthase F0 subunit B [Desulfobacterales bacterium]